MTPRSRRHGLALAVEADDDVSQALLHVEQAVGQGQDGHDLRRRGDVEAALARDAVGAAAEADDDLAQGALVHVHDPRPGHVGDVNVEGVAVEEARVEGGGQEVVGRADGVEIAVEWRLNCSIGTTWL